MTKSNLHINHMNRLCNHFSRQNSTLQYATACSGKTDRNHWPSSGHWVVGDACSTSIWFIQILIILLTDQTTSTCLIAIHIIVKTVKEQTMTLLNIFTPSTATWTDGQGAFTSQRHRCWRRFKLMELICTHCLPEQHQIYRNMYQCTSCTLSCYSVHYPRFRTVQNILNGIDNWHGLCRVSEFRGNSAHRLFFRKPHHSRWQNTKTWHLQNFWNAISAISGYSNLKISRGSLPPDHTDAHFCIFHQRMQNLIIQKWRLIYDPVIYADVRVAWR